jgi:succinate-acetate transporter protein
MEPGSFTSEPQYQRPDQRNSDIDYIRRPEPVQAPAVVPGVAPVVPPTPEYGWDPLFARRLFDKMGREYITCNRLDYYGNGIPLGSWCYAIAFIIYGFYRCKVYRVNDTFLWSIILLFGGIGQCTAGFLEYCKGRTFPSALYLTYGFYCLSHYAYYTIPDWFRINQNMSMIYNYTEDSICCFYSAWVVLSFGLVLASAKTNVLYILQCITAFVFFLLRAAGEGSGSLGTKRNAAGILQAISGFFSLLICFSQILNNETFGSGVFPTCPLDPNNEIDVYNQYPPMYAPPTVPVATGPVVPVATAPVVPVATAPVQPPIV